MVAHNNVLQRCRTSDLFSKFQDSMRTVFLYVDTLLCVSTIIA